MSAAGLISIATIFFQSPSSVGFILINLKRELSTMNNKLISSIFAVLLISGCSTIKNQLPHPIMGDDAVHEISQSNLLSLTNNHLMHINERGDILYFQNFGGGGVVVGLLFGPFGALANSSAINANTIKDVDLLNNKMAFNPIELFKRSVKKQHFEVVEGNEKAISLSPYIYITKTKDEQLLFSSALVVETDRGKKSGWIGRYMYQTAVQMTKSDIADGVNNEEYELLESALEIGFDELARLYLEDLKGNLSAEGTITLVSSLITPRANISIRGDLVPAKEGRVNIRLASGLFSLPQNTVKVVSTSRRRNNVVQRRDNTSQDQISSSQAGYNAPKDSAARRTFYRKEI